MVFKLAYLFGVVLLLELSSALSHYDVLGVSRSSNAETIAESFNKLSEQLKPDKNVNDPDASRRYAALRLAYKILGDATSKENYDRMQSSELEDNETVSQEDRGKDMDRVIVGTYIPANDHAHTNSQTHGQNPPRPPILTEEESCIREEQFRIGMIQLEAMRKSLPWSILKTLTPEMICGLMYGLIVATIVGSVGVVIVGTYFTTVFLVKIVTNHWDMIIFFSVLLIIIRAYRGRYRQTLLHQD